MSWLEKLIHKKNVVRARKSEIPQAYGKRALSAIKFFTTKCWKFTWMSALTVITT